MFVITFQTRSIEQHQQFYEKLKASGVEMESVENNGLCGENFKFFDPDRIKFDVWNRDYKHETDPQWIEPEEKLLNNLWVLNITKKGDGWLE